MTRPLHKDPVFWAAFGAGLILRLLPMLIWGWDGADCTRDECIYKIAARPILEGGGLGLAPKGWLPAPGFPYLMAASKLFLGAFEAVKWVHLALFLPTLAVMAGLGARVGGQVGMRFMAVAFALHPTFIFFTGTMWTETVYTSLLTSSVLGALWAREGSARRAWAPGVALGVCVLFRGVATYLAPLFVVALLAPEDLRQRIGAWREEARKRAQHGAVFLAALVLVVAPYSLSASLRWGGPVVSDATLGHVIALGNDDYPPVTFDYGIGQLTGRLYARTLAKGRRDCPAAQGPIAADRCEVGRATAWIMDHPVEFVQRIPMRLAQLFNPHSFLTRHVRWGYWPGLPWELKELIVIYQVAVTWLVVLGGTIGLWLRGRGPWALLAAGVVAYHVGIIMALYGLTRFRLPIEPLWLLGVAAWLGSRDKPGQPLQTWRKVGLLASMPVLIALLSTYLWTGFPGM